MDPDPEYIRLNDLYKTIEKIIAEAPTPVILELLVGSNALTVIPEHEAFRLNENLDLLEGMAMAGDENSLKTIRDIGLRIAIFLMYISGSPDDEIQKSIDRNPSFFPESHAEVAASFDKRDLLQQLEESMNSMKSGQLQKLNIFMATLKQLRASDYYPIDFNALYESARPLKQLDAEGPSHPNSADAGQDVANGKSPESDAENVTEDIARWIIGRRLIHTSRRMVRRVLGKSHAWPILTYALADGRKNKTEEYVSSLGLGSSIGIKFKPKPGKGGSRTFAYGSQLYFTLNLLSDLDEHRMHAQHMSSSHLREYKADEEKSMSAKGLSPESGWNKENHWIRKASLLPSPSKEHLNVWLEACMSRLEACCDGNWEDFNWPSIIKHRVESVTTGVRGVSAKAAVLEVLRNGLDALLE